MTEFGTKAEAKSRVAGQADLPIALTNVAYGTEPTC